MNGLIAACVAEELRQRWQTATSPGYAATPVTASQVPQRQSESCPGEEKEEKEDVSLRCDIVQLTIPSVMDPTRSFQLYLSGVRKA